jgi:hypothetical protein
MRFTTCTATFPSSISATTAARLLAFRMPSDTAMIEGKRLTYRRIGESGIA